ncbi:MAG: GTPase Era [Deferribacteres bacterium]|nr:GTPase Era [Deferribacteres bacterium]
MDSGYKAGFVSLIGRPNVGKSSLLNAIIGRKVAIISDKPQTTRNRILAVKHLKNAQIIFIDTPGIHFPKHKLNKYMVEVAVRALKEMDVVLFVVDAKEGLTEEDYLVMENLKEIEDKKPIILVLNKIDLTTKQEAERIEKEVASHLNIKDSVCTSAVTGEGLGELIEKILELLPEGMPFYPEDMITDQPESFVIAEIIREKIFNLTRQEIPYSTAVVVERIEDKGNILVIDAYIFVEKKSQKGIIIGKDGKMLKKIGQSAREELERILGSKIYLNLWVKVKEKWRQKDGSLRELGYYLKKE